MEMQKKLNHEDPTKKMPTVKNLKTLKRIDHNQIPSTMKKSSTERRQMSDFDQLLQLIGNCPGVTKSSKDMLNIPEIDFNKVPA